MKAISLEELMGHWEYNGKRKRIPKDVIFTRKGIADKRYKSGRKFLQDLKDKKWVYKSRILDMWKRYQEKQFDKYNEQ